MAKIQVLEKHVAELIAAGEVVERPSSVIKELVENSIDAKATAITVEIQRGGVSLMRITDNGCGIDKEDVPVAFLRHATSKVCNKDDLDAIASLGFRGEALASISAVSKVELLTKTEDENIGTRATVQGSDIVMIEDAGCPKGTAITVRDIFYNIPARMKFLKKDVGEGNAVATVMDKVALSHPEVSFRFIRERKEMLYTTGDGKLSSAIYGVFGKEFLSSLMPVDYTFDNIRVWGYISKPSNSRPNRNMQNFFINGRYVKSRTAAAAIEEAFKGSVMVGKFPACVLHIEMAFSMLDVNVHPAKLEVRFTNEKPVFSSVYHAVKSALMSEDKPKEMQFKPKVDIYKKTEIVAEQINFSQIKPKFTVDEKAKQNYTNLIKNTVVKQVTLNDSEDLKVDKVEFVSKREKILEEMPVPEKVEILPIVEKKPSKIYDFIDEESEIINTIHSPKINVEIEEEIVQKQEIQVEIPVQQPEKSHKVIGEAFTNYLIIEYGDDLMFIDKHAAHERLLYEHIKENTEQYAQTLLEPVSVTLDKQSYNAVLENLDKLNQAGFVVEDFGRGCVLVRTAPLSLIGQDVVSSIIEISGYLLKQKTEITTEHLDWIYSNVACRAAIKSGTSSNINELIALAKKLEENPEIRYCPHGRPVYVMMKKRELEKQFGRI